MSALGSGCRLLCSKCSFAHIVCCTQVTIQDLDHGLLGLLNLVEPAGLAWYQTTPDKVRHAWPYLSPDARYHVIRRCVHAYKHIAEYKLGHNNSPQILEEHLVSAAFFVCVRDPSTL